MNEYEKTNILLIEDERSDARLVLELISEIKNKIFQMEWQQNLSGGIDYLENNPVDVILLDLMLPDSWEMESFNKIKAVAPNIPVIILTGFKDEKLAIKAVQRGAQDYLFKSDISAKLLERSIRYAIERQRTIIELKALSVIDELTGLYNRRGFLTLAEQQMKFANRNNKGIMLLFIDVDDLKAINDKFGHNVGDVALTDTADILKESFRRSDIIARIGGDEFAILALEAEKHNEDIILSRLREKVNDYNRSGKLGLELSLSIGVAHYDSNEPCSVEELMARADNTMYKQKHQK